MKEAFERDLGLLLEKSSKDLQRPEDKAKLSLIVRSGLSESKEAEAFAWNAGNPEVPSQLSTIQLVGISAINFRPRLSVV